MLRSSRGLLTDEDGPQIPTNVDERETGSAPLTFLDMLDFVVEHDIPSVKLTRRGLAGNSSLHDRLAF